MGSKLTDEIVSSLLDSGADSTFMFNKTGEVIHSNDMDHEANIAKMMNIIFEMNNDLSNDIKYGGVNQIITKSDDGLFVINQMEDDNVIAIFIKDITRLGVVLLTLNKFLTIKQ